jgi:hypothetical protein
VPSRRFTNKGSRRTAPELLGRTTNKKASKES